MAGADLPHSPAMNRADLRLQRVVNLLTALLYSGAPRSQEELTSTIEGYPPTPEARRSAFEDDKKLLRGRGFEIELIDKRYRIDPKKHFLPDLDLTESEEVALRTAIRLVSLTQEQDQLPFARIGVAFDDGGAGEALALRAHLANHELLSGVYDAMARSQLLELGYDGVPRVVEPHGLRFLDGFWYVVVWDRLRNAPRNLRIDRIGELRMLADAFVRRTGVDVATDMPAEPWRMGNEDPVQAEVRIDPAIAFRVWHELSGRDGIDLQPQADGSLLVRLVVTRLDGFRSWLLGMLDHAVVIGPADLRAEVAAWLASMASR